MQATATAKFRSDPSSLQHASDTAIRLFRTCRASDEATISVMISSAKDMAILNQIAGRVNPDFMGFKLSLSSQKITAGEFLQSPVPRFGLCELKFTGPSEAQNALNLLEELITKVTTPPHNSQLIIFANGLIWEGAPDNSLGSLSFIVSLEWGGKVRIKAVTTVRFEAPAKTQAEQALREFSKVSGLDFKLSNLTLIPTPTEVADAAPPPAPSQAVEHAQDKQAVVVLAHEVAYEQALDETKKRLEDAKLSPETLPGFFSQSEAWTRRAASYGKSNEKVDLNAALKRMVKGRLPSFKSARDQGGIAFQQTLTSNWDQLFEFDKVHFQGMGKTFTLSLAVTQTNGPLAGRSWRDNIFKLWGYISHPNGSPCWSYNSNAELESALSGLADLLDVVLPVYQESVLKYLVPPPMALRKDVERRSGLTARAALAIARTVVPVSPLCGVGGGPNCSHPHHLEWVSQDGSATESSQWSFVFKDEKIENVIIPAIGPIRTIRRHRDDKYFHTLPVDWIDSSKAVQMSEENGGREFRAHQPIPSLALYWSPITKDARWQLSYKQCNARGREDLLFFIAADGSEVKTIKR